MTSTQNVIDLAKELVAALDAGAAEEAKHDPKFDVTSEFVELPKAEVDKLLKDYKATEKKFKLLKQQLEEKKAAIIMAMNGAEVLVVEETKQQVVDYHVVHGTVCDTVKLKKDQPELWMSYQKERTQRPFKILV